eukprot:TRINITY_DN504_c0_g1_i4.p1 TRINITY_DN504_c0_g1~~TRINITY_DN504_c0_g1_i4.p1  ORF type:complete len:607 (+),score=101.88 TRINITY_DN504_c0_g1_i4:226-2046(+)
MKTPYVYAVLFILACYFTAINAKEYGFLVVNIDGDNYRAGPAQYGPSAPDKGNKLQAPVVAAPAASQGGCLPFRATGPSNSENFWILADYAYNTSTCDNTTRTYNAQRAGAIGLLLASDVDAIWVVRGNDTVAPAQLTIPTVWLDRQLTAVIKQYAQGHEEVGVWQYKKAFLDFSYILIISIGIGTLIIASLWSGFAMRDTMEMVRRRKQMGVVQVDEGEEDEDTPVVFLSVKFAAIFVAVASSVLLLFFFVGKLIILTIILYCIGAFNGTWACLYTALAHFAPGCNQGKVNMKWFGDVSYLRLVTGVPVLVMVVWWFIVRREDYAWVMQDIMGCCFVAFALRVIAFPDIKVATVFLIAAFCYDIFWVFISTLIFKKSVMASVATSGGSGEAMPMVLKVPSFTDEFGAYALLGLGDIFIPGMLVAFLCRFDYQRKQGIRNGYFVLATAGYAVALLVTILAVKLMNKAQPALLYIVPLTLGPTVLWAWRRGDLRTMWQGPGDSVQDQSVELLDVPPSDDDDNDDDDDDDDDGDNDDDAQGLLAGQTLPSLGHAGMEAGKEDVWVGDRPSGYDRGSAKGDLPVATVSLPDAGGEGGNSGPVQDVDVRV